MPRVYSTRLLCTLLQKVHGFDSYGVVLLYLQASKIGKHSDIESLDALIADPAACIESITSPPLLSIQHFLQIYYRIWPLLDNRSCREPIKVAFSGFSDMECHKKRALVNYINQCVSLVITKKPLVFDNTPFEIEGRLVDEAPLNVLLALTHMFRTLSADLVVSECCPESGASPIQVYVQDLAVRFMRAAFNLSAERRNPSIPEIVDVCAQLFVKYGFIYRNNESLCFRASLPKSCRYPVVTFDGSRAHETMREKVLPVLVEPLCLEELHASIGKACDDVIIETEFGDELEPRLLSNIGETPTGICAAYQL